MGEATESRDDVIVVPVSRLLSLLGEELAPRRAIAIIEQLKSPRAERAKPRPEDYERAWESIRRKGRR